MRDRQPVEVEVCTLVPGDVLVISEGGRVCADARIIDGDLHLDLCTLTDESLPAARPADQLTAPDPSWRLGPRGSTSHLGRHVSGWDVLTVMPIPSSVDLPARAIADQPRKCC